MKKIGLISLICLAFAFSAIAQKSDKKLEKDFDKMENEMDKAFEMMKESMGTFQSLIQDLEMPDMKNFEFDGDLEMPEGKLDMNELFGFLEQSMGELNKMDWSGFNKMFEQLAESMQEVAPNFEVNPNQMKDKKDRKSKKF
jgi:hypothetical protein